MGMTWSEYKTYRQKKRKEEQSKKEEEQNKSINNKQTNIPSTYKRTIQPSATQTISNNNKLANNIMTNITGQKTNLQSVNLAKKEELKNQKLERIYEDGSTWGNIVKFFRNTGRAIDNLKEGAKNGIIGAGQSIIRDVSDIENFSSNASQKVTNKIFSSLGDKGKVTNMFVDASVKSMQNKRNEDRRQDLEDLQDIKNANTKNIQKNIFDANMNKDPIGTKLTELAPSMGQQLPGYAMNAVLPGSSLLYFKLSSEANYYDDAKERGMTEGQSKVYSKLMSWVEAGTEQLSVENIQKGGQTIKALSSGTKNAGLKNGLKAGIDVFKETAKEETVNSLKEGLKNYGIGIAEEAFQEAITEPIQEFTAMKVAGEDKADWNNMWQRMLQSGFDGALSSAIIAGANMGVSSCQGIVTKIENGQEISNQEYNKAVKDASKKVNIEKLATDGIKNEVSKLKSEMLQNHNIDNKVINQEQKTSQNGFSEAEKTESLRQEARDTLEILKQDYDERTYSQMQELIETAPSKKALEQVVEDLNTELEYRAEQERKNIWDEIDSGAYEQQNKDIEYEAMLEEEKNKRAIAPLKPKQEVQLPMKQETQNKSFEDVAFEAMSNYESNEVESPLKNRDMDSIGKQTKVNAYQYDNPQVKPYFQEMAQQMGEDLAYIASPENRSTKKGGGTKLSTSTKAMDILHNEQGYSYNQIAQGLQNIIDDKGSENNAISKKIELVIDEQLRNGYTNALGKNIEPNQEYINTIQGNKDVQLPMKQKQEVSLPLNENVVNNQNTSQEQNQTISKDTNKVMNEVQNYIKNNDLDMTTDEFVEWASNVELENEENMTEQQKELYSLISDIQNRASMEENNTRNNNIPNNVSIKDSQGREIDHNIHTYSTDAYEGQVNMRKEFQDEDGNTIAKIDYNYFDGEINVDVIETNPEYRRKGLATRLVKDLKQDAQEEGVKINYGYTSSDGTALLNAIEKEENIANNQEKIYNSSNEREGDYNGGKSKNTINRINEETSRTTSNDGNKESTDGFSSTSQSNDNLVTEQQRSDIGRNKETGKDNKGRILTEEQNKKYKDDKARDEQGNLLVFYHSTANDFNIYDKNKSGKNYNWLEFGDGFYFTPSLEMAKDYAEYGLKTGNVKIKEQYLDCKNPFYIYKKNNSETINAMALEVENRYNKQYGTNLKINEFRKESGARFLDFIKDSLGFSDKEVKQILQKYGYDGIDALEIKDGEYRGQYVVFEPNQIKNVDNLNPTDNPDIRYELEDTSNNTAENEIQRKINRSMTMEQAKDMVQRAFVTGNIYDWFDGEYKNGDEWLAGVGASDVALVIDNDFNLQNKYVNANNDILNDEYTIDDVIEAYQNGTLTGSSENQTQRLDTSKDTGYKDDRFYAPKDITGGKELYDLASQRVTSKNRNEIYKARADFIINAHNEGYIESLGLDSKEVYEKLRSWTSYPKNALQTSMEINKGVSKENRWTGIENCSVVNELSVSKEQLDSLVKEIKGTSDDYQRRYISNTMLALDTHLNYKNLTFDFAPDATNMGDSVLGDYQPDYDVIRVKRDGQNTVSHEMGHYIDHLIGRELANGYNLGVTRLCRSSLDNMMNGTTFTQEQKQFLRNFANFLEDIENSSDIGSSYKMSSDEVFARFVARFTEWTRNVATGNRYGYEAKWYDDHFNQSQYKEFAKLLQEYSLLKTTEQASGRSTTLASQRTGQIQEQKIEDIFNELNKKKKTQENTEQSQKVQLPMKEKQEVKLPMKENVQQTQENTQNTKGETINWNEIERPENNQKFRKHYRSIIESSNTTAEAKAIAKELMGTDTYTPESNKSQIQRADNFIEKYGVEKAVDRLMTNLETDNFTYDGVFKRVGVDDIALGERLIQYFSKTGDGVQLQNVLQATAMAGTEAGRAVQVLSILNHQTPQGQATWIQRSVDKMNTELAKRKGGTITTDENGNIKVINKQGVDITNKVDLFNLTPEMINKIIQSENQDQMWKNIDEVYEELGQQVPKSMLGKIDSWRYFSMLANARTHIRNMVGNFAMGKMQRAKDKLAGGIEDVVSKFNPEMERTKTLRRADAKTKEFARNDFKNADVQSMMELNENKYHPQSRLENARKTFKSDALENTLGRLFNLNDKLLSAEDGIGLKAGYQKALADYITANKIDVDNITDAQLNKARNYAVQQAKEATFHQANAIASAVAQFENKNLATKLFTGAVLPFKKTPMNVAKAGMEYSPLQIAKSATVDLVNLRKGNISVNQYIDNLSKGMTGTGIALVGYALANAGILKASGGDDKDKEKYEEEQGKQSYSIQIAGKTYSLDWLAPTGIPLFIGAETFKLFNQENTEKSTEKSSGEDKLKQAIKGASNLLNAGATAINPMSEMSMISGLTSALSSYNTSDNLGSLGNIMTNAGKSYINQFVPTALGQLAKTTDKYERTTKSTATGTIGKAVDQTINQIKNKIPGLRQTLPIKTDIWGNDVKQEVNLPLRAVNNFINPATVKEVSTDKVDMELNKLYEENHSSSLLPDILTKTVQLNKQTYRLSNKEYAEFTKNYGQTSHKLIENFIKTSDYNKLTQEQKETAISNIYSYAKEQNKMDYAKKVNETVKPSTLYTTMKEIEKNGGKQSEYLSYLAKTKGMSKESEKNKVLADSNYSNRTKEIIYTNGTGKDDNLYNNLLSKSHINMTEYLDYKDKVSNKVFSADKDKNGKTVTGSAKAKVINYLNNNITGVGNRLLIAGKSYALQNNEKQKLAQYINSIANTREERIEIYKQLDKNFYVRNGKVYMRVSK